MITSLTEQQIQSMHSTAKEWIDIAHSQKYCEKSAEDLVVFAYRLSGLNPPKIVHADSPMSALIICSMLKNRDSVGASVVDSVGASVVDSVWASVGASVVDSVGASVGDSVWASVWASVGASVRDSVGDSVWASVRASVWDRCGYLNFSDFGWTGFYDFFLSNSFRFCEGEKWDNFRHWRDALKKSNIFECYTYENIAVCVRPPKIIKENGRLHSATEAAIQFRDGYCQHYINGRNLPEWIWLKKDTITKERFLKEKNAEIRGGMYAVLGQKRVFDLIGASEVCRKFANNETYILYRTNEKIGDKHWQWVGVKCPSTATNYLLGVPETVTCPIEAVAGTFGLTAKEYIINQHT